MRIGLDVLKLEDGCLVVDGKLIATGGLRAITTQGKRYIKLRDEDEKRGFLRLFYFSKRIGACCRCTAEDDGTILTNLAGKRTVNRKNNARRAKAMAELQTTINEEIGNQVSTGSARSVERLNQQMYKRKGIIAVSLGIKDPDKKHLDISKEAFSKFPLNPLAVMECLDLPRTKRVRKMRQLMKKYPQVNV